MPRTTHSSKVQRAKRYLSGGGVTREDSDDELGWEDHPWEWIYAPSSSIAETADGSREEPGANGGEGKERKLGAKMGNFQCYVGDCVLLKAEDANEAWIGLICELLDNEEEEGGKSANFMWFSTEREIRNKEKKRMDFLPNEVYLTPSWDVNPLTSINGKAKIVSPDVFRAKYPTGKVPRSSRDHGKIFVCRRGCNTRTATYTEEFIWEDIYNGAEDVLALIDRVQSQTKATRKRKRDTDYQDEVQADVQDDIDLPKTPRKRRTNQTAVTPSRSGSRTGTPKKLKTPQSRRVVIKKPLTFTPLSTRLLSPAHTTSSPFQIARTHLHVSSVPASLPCRQSEFTAIYSHLESSITSGTGSCIYISGVPGTGKTATVREVVSQLHASVLSDELDDFIFVEINGMKVTDPLQSYSLLWEALRNQRVSPTHALDLLEREFSSPNPRRVPCVVLMDELDQLVTKNQSLMYNFFNWPNLPHSRLIVLAVANTMDLPERMLSNKISSRLGLTRVTFAGYTHAQLQEIITSRLESVPGEIVDPDAIQFAARKVAAVSGDARRTLDICRRAVEIAEAEAAATGGEENEEADPLLATPSKKKKQQRRPTSNLAPAVITDKSADSSSTTTQQNNNPSSSSTILSSKSPQKSAQKKITISTIKLAIQEFTSSPLQQYLKSLPLACKIFLAALLARVRRSSRGGGTTTMEAQQTMMMDILAEAKRLCVMNTTTMDNTNESVMVADVLVYPAYSSSMVGGRGGVVVDNNNNDISREEEEEDVANANTPSSRKGKTKGKEKENEGKKKKTMVPRILGMSAAAQELADAGVIALEGASGAAAGGGGVAGGSGGGTERCGKVRLKVAEEEVRMALRDDVDVKGMMIGFG